MSAARRKADDDDEGEENNDSTSAPPAAKRTRRTRSAASTDSGATGSQASSSSASSAAAPATSASGPRCHWQWEADGGKWTDFSDDHQQELSDGLTSSQASIVLTIPNTTPAVKMRVLYSRMVQANDRTGYERSIRCLDPSCHGNSNQRKFASFCCRSGGEMVKK